MAPLPCHARLREGDVIERVKIHYVYISHGHHDHFHPATLDRLERSAKMLVHRDCGLKEGLASLGFEVIELSDDDELAVAPDVRCRILHTHSGDTLLAVRDRHEVCLNLNDSLHSAPGPVQDSFVKRLRELYPSIDYVFCGYGVASHFPNCYIIPGKDRAATATKRQRYFNGQWARLIANLQPCYGFPYAADVAFLEHDLIWVNEPTHNTERPTDAFRASFPISEVTVTDIAPGFVIERGRISKPSMRMPLSEQTIRLACREQMERANRLGTIKRATYEDVGRLLRDNVARCSSYLIECDRDYRFLIRFRECEDGFVLSKRGRRVELSDVVSSDAACDVVFTTRLHYLRRALTSSYGHEVLFVGSGCTFTYRDRRDADRNLHRELLPLLRQPSGPPRSRYGDSSPLVYAFKQRVKAAIGRQDEDLYDLAAWTVYEGNAD
jgi:hypothetical protein